MMYNSNHQREINSLTTQTGDKTMTNQMINQEMQDITADLFIEVSILLTAEIQTREASTEEVISYINMNNLKK